jgi:Flp pilus assembly protein TadB
LLLFATMALMALAVIGPKHMQRQQRLVRMQDTRQRVAASTLDNQRRAAGDSQSADSQSPELEQPTVSVALLWALLLALWVAAATALLVTSRRSAPRTTGEQPPP